MFGHRSIYHDGWRAVCPWPGTSFTEAGMEFGTPITAETLTELDATGWELYHVAEDFAENHNVADQHFRVEGDSEVGSGRHVLSVEFQPTGEVDPRNGKGTPGDIKLFIDGEVAGEGHLPVTIPILAGLASGVSVGADAGSPVTDEYEAPFELTGHIEKIVYDVSGKSIVDHEAEIRAALARQ